MPLNCQALGKKRKRRTSAIEQNQYTAQKLISEGKPTVESEKWEEGSFGRF